MNFALEELRQVDFSRYNKKVKLRYFCSFALRFFNRVVVAHVSFSALRLVNIRISLLIFQNPLAYCRAYFLHSQVGKHRNSFYFFTFS